MKASDMLDYALGRLEGRRRLQLERAIAGDPSLAKKLSRLTQAIHRLLDDEWDFGQPPVFARVVWPTRCTPPVGSPHKGPESITGIPLQAGAP